MNVDDFDLLAADDTKAILYETLALPTALPHGKDVAIHRAWTAYSFARVEHTPSIFVSSPK